MSKCAGWMAARWDVQSNVATPKCNTSTAEISDPKLLTNYKLNSPPFALYFQINCKLLIY
jgi:hypothetical protein